MFEKKEANIISWGRKTKPRKIHNIRTHILLLLLATTIYIDDRKKSSTSIGYSNVVSRRLVGCGFFFYKTHFSTQRAAWTKYFVHTV